MKLLWTDRARKDLIQIGRYIAKDNPQAARRWVELIRQAARRTSRMPLAGRVVPEFNDENIREVFLKTYRIVYHIKKKEIHVLTVFEGHRLLKENEPVD